MPDLQFWHGIFIRNKANETKTLKEETDHEEDLRNNRSGGGSGSFDGNFWICRVRGGRAANFPYFQLGCLIVGGLIMVSLKRKYNKMYTAEVVGAFALYTLLMALFTNPVIDAVKNIVT